MNLNMWKSLKNFLFNKRTQEIEEYKFEMPMDLTIKNLLVDDYRIYLEFNVAIINNEYVLRRELIFIPKDVSIEIIEQDLFRKRNLMLEHTVRSFRNYDNLLHNFSEIYISTFLDLILLLKGYQFKTINGLQEQHEKEIDWRKIKNTLYRRLKFNKEELEENLTIKIKF
jgi:hypothetical protein